jgi:hypothetical protein
MVSGQFHKIAKNKHSLCYVCPSLCMEQFGSHWTIFMKFDIWEFFKNVPRKFKFHQNLTRIMGTLHHDLCKFISQWILLRMRNVSDKSCKENQNILHVHNFFHFIGFTNQSHPHNYWSLRNTVTTKNFLLQKPFVCWYQPSFSWPWKHHIQLHTYRLYYI